MADRAYIFQRKDKLPGGYSWWFSVGFGRNGSPIIQLGNDICQGSSLEDGRFVTLESNCTLYGTYSSAQEASETAVGLNEIQKVQEA